MRNSTVVLYIIYFLVRYYLPINFLNKKIEEKKILQIIFDPVFIVLIYFIGESLIINNLDFMGFYINQILKWMLFSIVILKPVNTNFKIFFGKYAPKKDNKDTSDRKNSIEGAGAMIGNLERLLIAILMFYGQYGAIGLVFTAKSVTRYDKITKEPSFAEYYLIGSLYSMLCVLILYGLII